MNDDKHEQIAQRILYHKLYAAAACGEQHDANVLPRVCKRRGCVRAWATIRLLEEMAELQRIADALQAARGDAPWIPEGHGAVGGVR